MLPNFCWGFKLLILKSLLKKVGKNVHFGPDCQFYNNKLIEIGNNVFIGNRSTISTKVQVKIGDNVMFGPEVMIIGGDHNFSTVGIPMIQSKKGGCNFPIVIENDVWIGARALILKGVKIREGSVIGAQSLVNKDVLPYSINAGNPSRYIKPRYNYDCLNTHLKAVDSIYTCSEIKRLYQEAGQTLT